MSTHRSSDRVRRAMTRTAPCLQPTPLQRDDRHEARCITEWNEAMKGKDRIEECEYQDGLESLLKNLQTQLRPLTSLETATKKRRAQKEGSKQFCAHEINGEDFRLMARPAAPSNVTLDHLQIHRSLR